MKDYLKNIYVVGGYIEVDKDSVFNNEYQHSFKLVMNDVPLKKVSISTKNIELTLEECVNVFNELTRAK